MGASRLLHRPICVRSLTRRIFLLCIFFPPDAGCVMTAPSLADIRVLLVQARNTPDMEEQEQTCFLERCQLEANQLIAVNVVRDEFDAEMLDPVQALLIGGAGEYSAYDDWPWMPRLFDLIREAAHRMLPTFGSCWGHQVIARAFGGTVAHDPDHAELGSGMVTLTEAGRRDPILRTFPPQFRVNMGHHDRVTELPPNAVELAFNESQRNQAFRIRDKPIYGTQFHSELNAKRERERLIAYREYYRDDMPSEQSFQDVIDDLVDTSEVDRLLHDFLTTFATALLRS